MTDATHVEDDPFADIAETPRRAADPMPLQLRLANTLLPTLDPFMACFAREMKWVSVPWCDVMATNSLDTFYYNKVGIETRGLKAPLLACIIAHEIKHILRIDSEFMRGRNPEVANIALDAVINRDLLRGGWKFPDMRFIDPVRPFDKVIAAGTLNGIATPHMHETALSIYSALMRRQDAADQARRVNSLTDAVKPLPAQSDKQTQDRLRQVRDRAQKAASEAQVLADTLDAMDREKARQQAQEKAAKKEAAKRQQEEDDAKAQEQDQADSADPFEDISDDASEGADPFEGLDDADDKDESSNGDAGEESDSEGEGDESDAGDGDDESDDADSNDGDEGEGEGEGDEGDDASEGAGNAWESHLDDIGESLQGTQQGHSWSLEESAAAPELEKLGLIVSAPMVRLERALGSRVQGIMKGWSKRARSFQTPHSLSRRFNRIMPGARQQRVYQIAIAIDCSSSISIEDLQLFSALAHAWSRKFARQADIHMCFFNTQVVREGTSDFFANEDNIPRPSGGTDFKPVFGEWLENLQHRPTHVLHFSDLMGDWPAEPQGVHVVHLVPPNYRDATAPFGEILVIEE